MVMVMVILMIMVMMTLIKMAVIWYCDDDFLHDYDDGDVGGGDDLCYSGDIVNWYEWVHGKVLQLIVHFSTTKMGLMKNFHFQV